MNVVIEATLYIGNFIHCTQAHITSLKESRHVRGKPELFAEHCGQARLFHQSQTPVEQAHIANAFRFELTWVQPRPFLGVYGPCWPVVDTQLVARAARSSGGPFVIS